MGEVVNLDVSTRLEVDPQAVLNGALEENLVTAMVLGWDADGKFYIASSDGDCGALLLLLECAKQEVLDQVVG